MNEPKGERSKSRTGLHAIGAAVRPAWKAKAVEIGFVDANGSDFAVLLARPAATDLIMYLVDALSAEEGRPGPTERMREAQLLLRALIEPRVRKARWVAQRLGVGERQSRANRGEARAAARAGEVDRASLKPWDSSRRARAPEDRDLVQKQDLDPPVGFAPDKRGVGCDRLVLAAPLRR